MWWRCKPNKAVVDVVALRKPNKAVLDVVALCKPNKAVHDALETQFTCCKILATVPQEFAQRAMVAYVRSEFLQPNKAVHDVTTLPAVDLAQSWGLLTAPRLRFLKKVSGSSIVTA
eukprot:scaffold110120_cov17-Tisochrysis_lutea.AAC.1